MFDLVVKHILPGMGLFFYFVLHFNCKFAPQKEELTMTKLDTQLVHGPAVNDNCTGAVTTPIYKATTFEYPEIGAPVTIRASKRVPQSRSSGR